MPAYDSERPRVHYLNISKRGESDEPTHNFKVPDGGYFYLSTSFVPGRKELGNSIWLYDLKFVGSEDSRRLPVNLNIPLTPEGCQPRLTAWRIAKQTETVDLKFECLPLSNEPTEMLLWVLA